MSAKLSGEDVTAFWKFMCKKYGTRAVSKADAVEMRAVSGALAAMGIMDEKEFLKSYTTTVGNTIYVPTVPGGPDADLVSQVAICVHEHVHVRQFKDPLYSVSYLASSPNRTIYECEAYRATMEMVYALTGKCSRSVVLARGLKNYACTQADIEVAQIYLGKAASVIKKGGVVTPESKVALAWLRKKGVVS